MRFSCDSCGAQYAIDDSKLKGSAIRVRCKKCKNVITVEREEDLSATFEEIYGDSPENEMDRMSTRVFTVDEMRKVQAERQAATDDEVDDEEDLDELGGREISSSSSSPSIKVQSTVQWYLAINDEQLGPLSDEEVKSYGQEGKLDSQTLIWKAGFEDWQSIDAVEEFASFVNSNAAEMPPQMTEETSEPGNWDSPASSELRSLVQEEMNAVEDENSFKQQNPAEQFSAVTDSGRPKVQIARRDQSGTISQRSTKLPLIIIGIAVVLLAICAYVYFVVLPGGVADQSVPVKKVTTVIPDMKNVNKPKDENKAEAKVKNESLNKEAVKPVNKAVKKSEDKIAVKQPEKQDPKKVEPKEKQPKTENKVVKTDSGTTKKPKKSKRRPKKKRRKTSNKEDDLLAFDGGSSSSKSNLPKTLTQKQITNVVRKNLSAIKKCVQEYKVLKSNLTGKIIMSWTINPKGNTSKVLTKSPEHNGTFLAKCMIRAFEKMKFDKFSGDPITVNKFPIKLN